MLLEHSQGWLVVTEPVGPAPQRWMVPGVPTDSAPILSPDGRWLAEFDSRGNVLIWDVHRRSGPEVVRAGQQSQAGEPLIAFSPDSRRLVWLAPATPDGRREIVVWNVADRTGIPHPLRWVSETNITAVWLTDDPDLAMFRYDPIDSEDSRLVVRELTGGSEVRTMSPGSVVVQDGKSVLSCTESSGQSGRDAIISILRSDTGAESLRFPLPGDSCSGQGLHQSADRNYLVAYGPSFEGDHEAVKVVSLSDGSAFDVVTPPERVPPSSSSQSIPFGVNQSVGVFQSGSGQVTMFFARGSTLFRVNDLTPDLRGPLKYNSTRVSDNGRYLVIREYDAVTVLERDTGQELGRLADAGVLQGSAFLAGDRLGDHLSILVTVPGSRILTQYSLPDLEPQARYVLPTAVDGIGAPDSLAVAEGIDNRLLVALAEGLLSVWNTKTTTMIGEPIRLGSTPEEQVWYQQNAFFAPRPGHPDQIAILAPDGSVELWDIEKGRSILTIPTKIDKDKDNLDHFGFDNTGDRLVHIRFGSTIEVWEVETARPARVPIAAPDVGLLLGFDSANRLVARGHGSLSDNISFWDLGTGRRSGPLRLATTLSYLGTVATGEDGQRIEVGGFFDLPYKLPITAEQWFDHLCSTLDRGFTEPERELLPPGTDPNPPCSTDQ